MAFRRNLRYTETTPVYIRAGKYILISLLLIGAIIWGFILYFNGQNIKAPLLKFLSERTSFTISCNEVEFSPLYPNILKLKGVRFGKSKVAEIYIDYDLKSAMSQDSLNIKYLYAKEVTLDKNDLKRLDDEKFSYKDIAIEKLDLLHAPVYLEDFTAENADFSALSVYVGEDGRLSFKDGTIRADEAEALDTSIRKLEAKVDYDSQELRLSELSAQIFGGSIFADLSIFPKNRLISFKNIGLSNVIFQDYKAVLRKYQIEAPSVKLSSCVLALGAGDLLMGQIEGEITNFISRDEDVNFRFDGSAGEISKPSMQITAENNRIRAQTSGSIFKFEMFGHIYSGKYHLSAQIEPDTQNGTRLHIRTATLKDAKYEPELTDVNLLRERLFANDTIIENLKITGTEFVSHIDELPLSVKSVGLEGHDLYFSRERKEPLSTLVGKRAFTLSFSVDSAYYTDVFIKKLEGTLNMYDPARFELEVPKVEFNGSSLNGQLYLDKSANFMKLKLHSDTLELADLNSSSFNRLFNGKVAVDVNLRSDDTPAGTEGLKNDEAKAVTLALPLNLEGHIDISTDEAIVSNFGLDLLNGGSKKDYKITASEFAEAIRDNDLGLYKLKGRADIDKGVAKFRLSTDLITSHLTWRGSIDLEKLNLDSKATFVTSAKDNITTVSARGNIYDPVIFVTAVTRGMARPGIDESVLKKEESKNDAASESSTDVNNDKAQSQAKPAQSATEPSEVQLSSVPESKDKAQTDETSVNNESQESKDTSVNKEIHENKDSSVNKEVHENKDSSVNKESSESKKEEQPQSAAAA